MAEGLQVFAPNGNLISDINTRAAKLLGVLSITSSSGPNGTVSNPAFALGSPFYQVKFPSSAVGFYTCTVSISGTTLTWYISSDSSANGAGSSRPTFVIIYGIL